MCCLHCTCMQQWTCLYAECNSERSMSFLDLWRECGTLYTVHYTLQMLVKISFFLFFSCVNARFCCNKVIYLCIIFVNMHSIFTLPGWRHECILKKEGVSQFGLVFWWRDGEEQCRWEGTKTFAHLLCVQIVFEEYFVIPFFFLYPLTCTVSLHPFTKIPDRND